MDPTAEKLAATSRAVSAAKDREAVDEIVSRLGPKIAAKAKKLIAHRLKMVHKEEARKRARPVSQFVDTKRYAGAMLRKIRSERGVGRPPWKPAA